MIRSVEDHGRRTPLHGIRFAQASGLDFVEEQLTDPERLGRAPEVITSTAALLGTGKRTAIKVVGFGLAGAAGLATYAALTQGALHGSAAIVPAALTFFACRGLFGWLLRRAGAWSVARSRG